MIQARRRGQAGGKGRRPVPDAHVAVPVDQEDTVTDRGEHPRCLRTFLGSPVELCVVDRHRCATRDVERELHVTLAVRLVRLRPGQGHRPERSPPRLQRDDQA